MDKYELTIKAYNRLAQAYEDKFMDLDMYDETYNTFLNTIIKKNATVLEIGCGPGNITKYLLKKRPDLKLLAIDMAPNMLSLAKKNNPSADFKLMDCRDILKLHQFFDAIMSGFCMPYISKEECEKQIEDCHEILNPGGVFYFSVIEDDYEKSGFEMSSDKTDQFHVWYHEEEYLMKAVKKCGFELLDLSRLNYSKADGSILKNLIFIVRKK